MAQFDVYVAKVCYPETDPRFEFKPVVQIKQDATRKDSFAVISHAAPKASWHGEIDVENYVACGLKQRSTIRLTQRLDEPAHKKQIGTLSPELAAQIVAELQVRHHIQRHKTESLDDTLDNYLLEVMNG